MDGNKIITTSSGGMLVTENKEWAERVRYWASQSRDPAPHYQHSEIGYNYLMSNLLAAVGRGQLRVLDPMPNGSNLTDEDKGRIVGVVGRVARR